jgi:hypothetical protein
LVDDWQEATKSDAPINILEDTYTSLTPSECYFTGITDFKSRWLEASPSDGRVNLPSLTDKPDFTLSLEALWQQKTPFHEVPRDGSSTNRSHLAQVEVREKSTQADTVTPSSTNNIPDEFGNWVGGIDLAQIATWQAEDPDIGWIIKRRLKDPTKPKGKEISALSRAARGYISQWSDLMLSNNVLYRRYHSKEDEAIWQLIH